ncbi:MAG TPA: twin-arginine translocation signal domain-containing protein [Terriglobia bacterium]|nr:twin-arginine translocation signal domain-containing protein [Terriglobia bacterium]
MKANRRRFLQATAATAAAGVLPADARPRSNQPGLDGFQIAKRHQLVRDLPTPDFFEGMLLGNGDIGLCITVRPDALGLHLGKEDSWDIRVSEDHYQHVLPFNELLKLWKRASEEAKRQGKPEMLYLESSIDFFRDYTMKVTSSYAKSWPRPWPCGIVWIHWDSRKVRVVRQTLDPSNGLFTLELEHDNLRGQRRKVTVHSFVNWNTGHVLLWTDDPAPFVSISYYPNLDRHAQLPPPEIDARVAARVAEGSAEFSGYQRFPATVPTAENPNPGRSDKDRSFALSGLVKGEWAPEGLAESQERLKKLEPGSKESDWGFDEPPAVFLRSQRDQPFRLDLTLFTSRDRADNVTFAEAEGARLARIPAPQLQQESEAGWKGFWSRSAVEFADKELEEIWYHNQYFLACCLREGKVAPGLFGNWTSGRIGTAWHGDYHMNYNTQQLFWGVFSSNHVDQNLPYVELVESILPMARNYAREKLGMPGAFFPHSAYPVPSQVVPYPAPPWGYEVCETPWTVQSLWWHYQYTMDEDFLRRVYPILRAATDFIAAFVKKESDGKYHIAPTASPENWGCTVDFRLNKDCIMDLALSEFLLDSTVEASRILGLDADQRAKWIEVRQNLAPYPKSQGPYGEVWLDVLNAPPEHVYNVPVTLAPVFPGEQVGIGRHEEHLEIARRTARTVRLEGGNDLVYQPLIRARLGMLDLGWLKNEVRYCRLPNGIANDRVRQIDGRYQDSTDFDFMMRMGVWTENLSLPGVLNECMLQSYTGTIRLFPNPQGPDGPQDLGPARFRDLRAAGAFLISAAHDGQSVSDVTLFSEKVATATVANPWPGTPVRVRRAKDNQPVKIFVGERRRAVCDRGRRTLSHRTRVNQRGPDLVS